MRHFTFALTALLLSLVFASRQANSSQEKMPMNVKRITPVLLVKEIEPIIPFWVDRLGFAKTIEVPDGNNHGFLRHEGIRRPGSRRPLHHLRPAGRRDATLRRSFEIVPNQPSALRMLSNIIITTKCIYPEDAMISYPDHYQN